MNSAVMLMKVSVIVVASPVLFLISFKSLLMSVMTVVYPFGLLVDPPVSWYWLSRSLPSLSPLKVISVASTIWLFMTSLNVSARRP